MSIVKPDHLSDQNFFDLGIQTFFLRQVPFLTYYLGLQGLVALAFQIYVSISVPFPGSKLIYAGVDGQSVKPGTKTGAASKLAQREVEFYEHFLAGVMSVSRVAHHEESRSVDLMLIPSYQGLVGSFVPLPGQGQKGLIVQSAVPYRAFHVSCRTFHLRATPLTPWIEIRLQAEY
ncbi:hypothetical protein HKBW3S47_01206 [Candidatus Hakubella thermalkaliphila]|uniref:Uncharacterized protein n=1 Tax=Candidatus Hakubella thermalkaliphila TaxID=2754717 RepID=A0A6V8Q452_9ACTN|nr:hypothetical protein HKBW3S47_01206 [Candidatus Hakubella thermalkaliphila]